MHDSPDPDAPPPSKGPLPSPDLFPSATPSSADQTALRPDTRSPGDCADDLATEVSDVGVLPGERATTARSFTACLSDIAPDLPTSSWKSLFLQTSGHLLAGRAVLTGADAMGHDLSTVKTGRYSDLIASEVLSRIRRQAPDSPELRLAHLLTFMRTINSDTIGIAATAMSRLGPLAAPPEGPVAAASDDEGPAAGDSDAGASQFEVSGPLDTADLTTHLVEDGLPLPELDRAGHHTIPPVLRTILRRLYDAADRHSESRSRRALGATSAEWLRAPAAYHLDGFDEALRQVADAGDWSTLTELWSHRGHALMFDHFDSTIEAYSKVPEVQAHRSAVLAEALGDCLQAADIGRRLGLSDPVTVLNKVNFEHSGVPTLSSQMDRIDDGEVTVDDILIMAIASMRRHRVLGQPEQGREAAQSAQELFHGRHNFHTAPSRLCEARFHLELGINTMFIGDIAGSLQLLRRSIIITELATASSPYLLQPANAYSAVAHAMLGNGPSSDVHLRHFDELMDRTRFSSPHALSAYTLARMIRAMDALDLDSANDFSMRLADPALGHHSWIGVALHRSLLGILRGDVGIEDKRLQQIIDTNRSTLPEAGILRDCLRFSLVCLHLAQGQTHLAQNVLFDADSDSVYIILSRANLHLTIGEYGTAAHLANRALSQKTLDLHAKASARAIQAASLLGSGVDDEADSAFVDALEYCRITASLVPVAMVPKSLRDRLIRRSSAVAHWDLLAPIFADSTRSHDGPEGSHHTSVPPEPSASHDPDDSHDTSGPSDPSGTHAQRSGERLRHRLHSVGETLRTRADHTLLSPSQRQLLALLDTQSSVSAIAAELSLVEGTVKNKLSNLYARLGVRNRRDALARGYEYGYLPLDRWPSLTSFADRAWTSTSSSGEVETEARKVTRMSATVRELVDEAYERRESTWRAALETVNDWVEAACSGSALLSGDRVNIGRGRIKDRMRTGEKLRRKLADANDEIHEAVEVENQVIDVAGARAVCRTEREQSALWEILTDGNDESNLSVAEVRDYSAHPKPSGYRGRHLIVEVPFDAEPSVLVELQLRTIMQDAWCVLAEEHMFKPGQALKSDAQQERLSVILSGLLDQADVVAGYIADDVGAYLGMGNASPPRTISPIDAADDVPSIEVTIRELNHSYVLAADEVGRHGIIRLENLGLTPENPEKSAFPHPGDKLQVRMDESNTTRYFIPVSEQH